MGHMGFGVKFRSAHFGPGQAERDWKPSIKTVIQNCWEYLVTNLPKFELIQSRTYMTKNDENVWMLFSSLDRVSHCFLLKLMRATRPHVHIFTHLGFLPVKTIMYMYRMTSSATVQCTLYPCFIYFFRLFLAASHLCLFVSLLWFSGFFFTSVHAFWN